jgi:uncharacterized delta-60 repeat protein
MDVTVRHLAPALAVLAALCLLAAPARAAPGDLDPSFAGDGRVSTLTSTDTFVPRAVAVQTNGRIVVGGYSCDTGTCGPTGDSSFRLMRFWRDGGLDTDFGIGGMVTTAVGVGRSQAFDIVLQPDGGILAGGVASADAADPGSFAVVRYRADGSLDTRSGRARIITKVGNGFDAISDLVPAPDGDVIAIGQAERNGLTRVALARYDADSSLDDRLGPAGTVPDAPQAYAYGAGGARLPDGRVVAFGAAGSSSAVEDYRLAAVPVEEDGAAGPSWTRPIGASYSFANAAVGLGDGRVLAAGVATEANGRPAMALVRSTPEGVLDPTWDGDGTSLVRVRDGTVAADVVLDAGGRVVAAGHATSGLEHAFALARLGGDGRVDRSFGQGGVILTSFPGATVARATALARQDDGRYVAAGLVCVASSDPQCKDGTARLALARYLGGEAAAPGPAPRPAPGGGAAPPRTQPFVSLGRRLRIRRGRARVLVRCLQAAPCRGTVALRRLRRGRRALLLGSSRATIPARRTRTVVVRLRRHLGRSRRVRIRVEFTGRDVAGQRRLVTRTVSLRRR